MTPTRMVPELHKEKPTASGTGPAAAPAKPTTQLPGNSAAKQLATSKLDLRYDGKSFGQWQNAWQTELSTDKRIEAVKALAAFPDALGYGKESAIAILDVAGEYDFNTIESDGEGKLKEAVLDQLSPRLSPTINGQILGAGAGGPAGEKPPKNGGTARWEFIRPFEGRRRPGDFCLANALAKWSARHSNRCFSGTGHVGSRA